MLSVTALLAVVRNGSTTLSRFGEKKIEDDFCTVFTYSVVKPKNNRCTITLICVGMNTVSNWSIIRRRIRARTL